MKLKKITDYEKFQKKLDVFFNQMLHAYTETNMLKEFCTLHIFDKQKKEFFQIANRVVLPKEFFHEQDNFDNSMIASDFVRAIVIGERDFVLKNILESKLVPVHAIKDFDYEEIFNILTKMNNPTDIFIPVKEYHNQFYDWIYRNKNQIKFEYMKNPSLLIKDKEIHIHWLSSDTDVKKIIVVDKSKLGLIQKTFRQSSVPIDIFPIFDSGNYAVNKNLMLYLADKDNKNFDFVFRTVISKPEITEKSAIIIDVKN